MTDYIGKSSVNGAKRQCLLYAPYNLGVLFRNCSSEDDAGKAGNHVEEMHHVYGFVLFWHEKK